jgi:transposase
MRFVSLKSAEQQAQLMQHRARDLLMRQRTQLINTIRAHMAELGITLHKDAREPGSYWRSLQTERIRRCRSTRVPAL